MTENTTTEHQGRLVEAERLVARITSDLDADFLRSAAVEAERHEARSERVSHLSEVTRLEAGIRSAELASELLRNKVRYSGFLMDAEEVSAESVQIETEVIELSKRLEAAQLSSSALLKRLGDLSVESEQLRGRILSLTNERNEAQWYLSRLKSDIELASLAASDDEADCCGSSCAGDPLFEDADEILAAEDATEGEEAAEQE